MIIVRLFLISLFVVSALHGNNIKWYGNYEKALITAKKLDKDLFVVVISRNCLSCRDDFSKIFLDPEVIEYINSRYISVIATKEFKSNYPIELFYTTKYPAYFFASSKNELFLRDTHYGNITKKELLNLD